MYILSKNDLEVELSKDRANWEGFVKGKQLYTRGVKDMCVDGRWLKMREMNDLLIYLHRVNRFKNATENWIREFEHFLTTMEGEYGRRQNARV